MNKIESGLKEAVSFVRIECSHDWKVEKSMEHSEVKVCTICKVRFTSYKGIVR